MDYFNNVFTAFLGLTMLLSRGVRKLSVSSKIGYHHCVAIMNEGLTGLE